MMNYGWWGMGGIGMVLFWILLVLAIVWLARSLDLGRLLGGGGAPPPREDRALEMLRERYARGEIDKEEFERRKRDLERRETS